MHLPLRVRRSILVTTALTVLITGCTSEMPGVSGPTTGSDSDASSSASTGTEASEFDSLRNDYDLELAQCLRNQGFDVKDPVAGKGIQESGPEINDAATICMKELGDPPVSAAKLTPAEHLETSLRWAGCFRDLGYEVVDPQLNEVFVVPDEASIEEMETCV